MKRKANLLHDELRPSYKFDYSKAVRGKYFQRLIKEGSNLVALDPTIAKFFPNSAAVNEALRSLVDFVQSSQHLTSRPTRSARKRT